MSNAATSDTDRTRSERRPEHRQQAHGEKCSRTAPAATSPNANHNEGDVMTDERQDTARPEQPGQGGFEEGHRTRPNDERVGQFSDGDEQLPDDHRVGQFSDGNEQLPDDTRQGKFSDSVDPDAAS
jgi:hypothetical protein